MWYFDVAAYRRLVRLVGRESDPQRRRRLRIVLAALPGAAVIHSVFFGLDRLSPRLRRTQVTQPVFIVGHARSGTTLLHHLLSLDADRFSWFRTWEMAFPSLLQKSLISSVAGFDRRFLSGGIAGRVRAWEDRAFRNVRKVHPIGLTEPEEDNFVLTFSATGGMWTLLFPSMGEVGAYDIDDRPDPHRRRLVRFYSACVRRQVAFHGPGRRHLSKNPSFSGWVASLLEEFPDAQFIVAVRHPEETIPSLLKLMAGAWKNRGWSTDEIATGLRGLADRSFHTYRHPFEVLEGHPETPWTVVEYRDLVSAPRATIEKVYADLGWEMTAGLRTRLDREQTKARTHRSPHRYSLEEFGLRSDAIRNELGFLYERYFDTPVETS